jgi:hypothetical protein
MRATGWHADRPALMMIPFDVAGDALGVAGTPVRVPNLLLTGGPELDAQRATVHGPRVIPSAP